MKKLFKAVWLFTAMILVLNACKENPADPGNGTSATLEAVISYSPQIPQLGEEVNLDASKSNDNQNIGYDIEWALNSKPSGSSATISSETQPNAAFVPDVFGDYVVSLTITNSSEGISDNVQETISIANPGKTFVELSGAINSDRTLKNIFEDPAQKDYLVTGDISVNAKLTVEPGVIIHFQEGLGMTVNGNGILTAVGKADSTIVFTGESQAVNGFWRGINIFSNSVENKISHAEISYAGSDAAGTFFDAANLTLNEAKVQLSNVTISHSGGYGIQTDQPDSEFPMQNMIFEENDSDHAFIHVNQMGYFDAASTFDGGFVTVYGGNTTADMTIAALSGAKYQVIDNVGFKHNITIDEGAEFEFTTDAGFVFNEQSTIKALGTATNKIVFTGTSKTPGAWKGIFIASRSVENIFEHVDISYAGSSNIDTFFGKTNMALDNAKIILRNVSFTGSAGYGLETGGGDSDFTIENSLFDNNAGHHMSIKPRQVSFIDNQTNFNGGDIEITGGNTDDNGMVTWSSLNNGTYYFSASAGIKNTVTIEAGAQFEMGTDVILTVGGGTEPGVIKAIGTSASPIVFSGRAKAKGAWGGIRIISGSIENRMEHIKIEYGGGTDLDTFMDAANLGIDSDAYLNLSNSAIENSANYGIVVKEDKGAQLTSNNITYSGNNNLDLNIIN